MYLVSAIGWSWRNPNRGKASRQPKNFSMAKINIAGKFLLGLAFISQTGGVSNHLYALAEENLTNKDDVRAAVEQGLRSKEHGQIKEAIAAFSKALTVDPNSKEALVNRCSCYLAVGQTGPALGDLNAALKLSPTDKELLLVRATLSLDGKRFGAAFVDFNQLLKQDKNSAVALFGRAQCYQALGNYKAAFVDFNRSAEIDNNMRTSAKLKAAECLAMLQQLRQAIAVVSEVIRAFPSEGEAYLLRAKCYKQLGKFPEAAQDFQRACSYPNYKAEALYGLAESYWAQKRKRIAIMTLCDLLKLNFSNTQALKLRGQYLMQVGEFRMASRDLSRTLKLNGPQADIYLLRGFCRWQLGDKEAALDDYGEAIRMRPHDPIPLWKRSKVYFDTGDDENAIADLSKAISLAPRNRQLYLKRAEIYDEMKETQLAARDRAEAEALSH